MQCGDGIDVQHSLRQRGPVYGGMPACIKGRIPSVYAVAHQREERIAACIVACIGGRPGTPGHASRRRLCALADQSASLVNTAAMVSDASSPANARRPDSISYTTRGTRRARAAVPRIAPSAGGLAFCHLFDPASGTSDPGGERPGRRGRRPAATPGLSSALATRLTPRRESPVSLAPRHHLPSPPQPPGSA